MPVAHTKYCPRNSPLFSNLCCPHSPAQPKRLHPTTGLYPPAPSLSTIHYPLTTAVVPSALPCAGAAPPQRPALASHQVHSSPASCLANSVYPPPADSTPCSFPAVPLPLPPPFPSSSPALQPQLQSRLQKGRIHHIRVLPKTPLNCLQQPLCNRLPRPRIALREKLLHRLVP